MNSDSFPFDKISIDQKEFAELVYEVLCFVKDNREISYDIKKEYESVMKILHAYKDLGSYENDIESEFHILAESDKLYHITVKNASNESSSFMMGNGYLVASGKPVR